MPLIAHEVVWLYQTDNASTHGQLAACSGAAVTADTGNDFEMSPSGTLGVANVTSTAAAATTEALFFWESPAIGYTMWDAGKWQVRFQYVSGGVGCAIEAVYVCRVNSAGVSQGTLASATGMNLTVSTMSTLRASQLVLNQASDVTASATDRVYIVGVVVNGTGAPVDIVWIPNAIIVTPIRKVVHVGEWVGTPMPVGMRSRCNVRMIPPADVQAPKPIEVPCIRATAAMRTQLRIFGAEQIRL